MSSFRTSTVLASLLVFTVGCGDSHDAGTGDGDVPIEELPRAWSESLCSVVDECIGPLADLFLGETDCVTTFQYGFEDGALADLEAAIDAGRVVYDPGKAGDCLAAIEAAGCDALDNPQPDICAEAIEGTVEVGGDCSLGFECVGHAFCDRSAGTCPGTCTDPRPAGGDCGDDAHCRAGLVCSEETSRCVAPSGAGAGCEQGEPPCRSGLVCIGADEEAGTPGTCRTLDEVLVAAEGESCDLEGGVWCQEGLSCVVTSASLAGVTLECRSEVGSGGSCFVGLPDQCPAGEYCAGHNLTLGMPEGDCEPLPSAGDPCADAFLGPRCEADHVCVSDVCRPLQRNGEGCMADVQCYSGVCDAGACTAPETCTL